MNKRFPSHLYWQRGMSLVELGIVLAIMGLVIASVVGGSYLLRAAKLRNVIAEISNYRSAIDTFEQTYGYLPGDFRQAYDYWGSACGTDDIAQVNSCNGDGDSFIGWAATTAGTPKEDLLAWEHLGFAELIAGSFSGTHQGASARYAFDVNAPLSQGYPEAMYMLRTESDSGGNTLYATRGTTLRLGALVDISGSMQAYPMGGVMIAKEAYALDQKMDDGLADKGVIYTIRQPTTGSSGCTTNVWSAVSASYDLADDTNRTCSLVFWYKKF